MDAAMGRQTDALTFVEALAGEPFRHDFYQTLRRLECLDRAKPRWGRALRPIDEPVRLGQDPDLSFAPAPLAALERDRDGAPPRLQVRLFGLLGPNGPLPLHLTECARERLRNAGDRALSRFLDLFHHRFIALFYAAWAQAQPHVGRDRPDEDPFVRYVGALIGVAPAALRDRDTVPDVAKLFHAAALARPVRNAEGLRSILAAFFGVPVDVEEFVSHWMPLGPRERTYLAREGARLGTGAVAGGRVFDRQHKFRIKLGPLTLAEYERYLPGGALQRQLADWVRQYLSMELEWDVRLVLDRREVPRLVLGGSSRLGWTSWLGRRWQEEDAADLCVHPEPFV